MKHNLWLLRNDMGPLTLYTRADCDALIAQSQEQNLSHILSLLKNDSHTYVSNVYTEVVALATADTAWAVTVNKKEYSNALICSPYTTYIKYPLCELKKFNKLWVKILVIANTTLMGLLCRLTKINQAVQVNNNFNSLIKHSSHFSQRLPQLTKLLLKKYSKHAITFYRVNKTLTPDFFQNLQKNNYCIFPDRIAHVFLHGSPYIKRSHTRRDISLLRKSPYQIVPHDALTDADADRISELYEALFVDKHSKFNPAYTKKYFRQAIREHWHHYIALRNADGKIDAFISWFMIEGTMICGPLGYDTQVDRKAGLYRQLVALCLQHANENNVTFNMGAGSDNFKKNRGSTEMMEYTAVYYQHLPFYRQIPWRLLRWACNKVLRKILSSATL